MNISATSWRINMLFFFVIWASFPRLLQICCGILKIIVCNCLQCKTILFMYLINFANNWSYIVFTVKYTLFSTTSTSKNYSSEKKCRKSIKFCLITKKMYVSSFSSSKIKLLRGKKSRRYSFYTVSFISLTINYY